jgi:hypothetical protein
MRRHLAPSLAPNALPAATRGARWSCDGRVLALAYASCHHAPQRPNLTNPRVMAAQLLGSVLWYLGSASAGFEKARIQGLNRHFFSGLSPPETGSTAASHQPWMAATTRGWEACVVLSMSVCPTFSPPPTTGGPAGRVRLYDESGSGAPERWTGTRP